MLPAVRYTLAIDAINEQLGGVAASYADEQVHFLDCSYFFVEQDEVCIAFVLHNMSWNCRRITHVQVTPR